MISSLIDDVGNPDEVMAEYYSKFRRGDMNLDDKLEETEFLYFEHPEHNPQSIKDLVEDMIQNFDRNQDKVKLRTQCFFFIIIIVINPLQGSY